jgi:hypothetical protein
VTATVARKTITPINRTTLSLDMFSSVTRG